MDTIKKFGPLVTLAALLVLGNSPAMAGGSYKFSVSCPGKRLVAQWNTGAIDPGQEFLRVSTGTNYPGCGIGDFDAARDAGLPVDVHEGPTAVVQGIPVLGPVLKFFHVF